MTANPAHGARRAARHLLPLLAALLLPVAAGAQDPAADRLYREAQRLMEAGQGEDALVELQLLVQQFPDDHLAPRALLRVIELHRARDDHATEATIQKLLAEYPRTPESAAAFLLKAEIGIDRARSRADLEEARTVLRRVPLLYGREAYPELEPRQQARIRAGELSLMLGEPDGAVSELLAAVEDEPPSHRTGRARLRLASALLEQGEWTAAAEELQRLTGEGTAGTTEGDGEDGALAASAEDRAEARTLLSLIHRRILRPLAGLNPWTTTSRFSPPGLELREPTGVAAAADGRILIADAKTQQVALVGADGTVLDKRAMRDARRPGWSPGGTAYVVGDSEIVLPFAGQRTSFLEPRPDKDIPLKGMLAAERGPFRDWFVITKGVRGLLSYASRRKGQMLLAVQQPEPEDLAQDTRGRTYLLDRKARQVVRVGVDRIWDGVVVSSSSWKRPQALALDRLGNIYVLDRGQRKLEMFDPSGRRLTSLGPNLGGGIELKSPEDLTVDGSGRLLIADSKLPFLVLLD